EAEAQDLAKLAARTTLAFRRRIAVRGEIATPPWAQAAEARALIPLVLSGKWNDAEQGDREAIEQLARSSYSGVNDALSRRIHEPDAPVQRVGDTWLIVSREDAWRLLSRYLTRDDMDAFVDVALEVLGEIDAAFDQAPDDRWKANLLERRTTRYSVLL